MVHGRILDTLSRRGLGGLHQVAEGGCHVFDGVDEHHLRFSVGRTQAGGSRFDDFAQLHDRGDGVLRGHSKLLLRRRRAGHQRLGVFNQGLGRLEDVFAVIWNKITS